MDEHVIMTVSLTEGGRAVLRDADGQELYSRASLGLSFSFVDLIKRNVTKGAYDLWERLHGRQFRGCPGVGNHTPQTCDSHFGEGIRWRK